jgi:pSer/pThr/pTyr-binding forkhead associated (FHA) protein
MAGPLAAIERLFERLLERPAARLFQARLEPIHLQRQLERTMEAERRLGSRRTYVPSSYSVLLHPRDMSTFDNYRDSLAADLAEALHAHARSRGYTLTARPQVELAASDDVATGDVVVRARPIQPPRDRRGTSDVAEAAPVATAAPTADASPPPDRPSGAQPSEHSAAVPRAAGPGTSVYAAPQTELPNAVLAVRVVSEPVNRVRINSGTLRVGRALDNDIVLADDRVSRHHGQFSVRFGTLVYSDLGSTNGSFLNGARVTEIALGPGDILQLGSSTLTVEHGD